MSNEIKCVDGNCRHCHYCHIATAKYERVVQLDNLIFHTACYRQWNKPRVQVKARSYYGYIQ